MKKVLKIISIAIIIVCIILLSTAGAFLAQPKGIPAYQEWQRERIENAEDNQGHSHSNVGNDSCVYLADVGC